MKKLLAILLFTYGITYGQTATATATETLALLKILEIANIPNEIGVMQSLITIQNNTKKTIIAIGAEVKCYDVWGKPATFLYTKSNTRYYNYATQGFPDEMFTVSNYYHTNPSMRSIKIKINKLRYEDGTIVTLKKPIEYTPKE